MTSKILLRTASVCMFIRLVLQIVIDYKIPDEVFTTQNYLWQSSDTLHNHEFFYWGFSIAFALVGRLLWVIAEEIVNLKSFVLKAIEPVFFFLLAFGVEEFVYHFYFTGATTIISAIFVAIAYFKIKGLSIKITYDQNTQGE